MIKPTKKVPPLSYWLLTESMKYSKNLVALGTFCLSFGYNNASISRSLDFGREVNKFFKSVFLIVIFWIHTLSLVKFVQILLTKCLRSYDTVSW